jgi:hypothetical protein
MLAMSSSSRRPRWSDLLAGRAAGDLPRQRRVELWASATRSGERRCYGRDAEKGRRRGSRAEGRPRRGSRAEGQPWRGSRTGGRRGQGWDGETLALWREWRLGAVGEGWSRLERTGSDSVVSQAFPELLRSGQKRYPVMPLPLLEFVAICHSGKHGNRLRKNMKEIK